MLDKLAGSSRGLYGSGVMSRAFWGDCSHQSDWYYPRNRIRQDPKRYRNPIQGGLQGPRGLCEYQAGRTSATLLSHPASPRRGPPRVCAPRDEQDQTCHIEDRQRAAQPPFEASRYRIFWTCRETIRQSSQMLVSFAEAYGHIEREQLGPHFIPERMPTEQEVSNMFSNAKTVKDALEGIKNEVQSIRDDCTPQPPRAKAIPKGEKDEQIIKDRVKLKNIITEATKRRGRAASPGRCHSCNRVDTPEWRRGPDGARTFCNACGLHYAKMERKRQVQQRNTHGN